jgi:hypothetical protein
MSCSAALVGHQGICFESWGAHTCGHYSLLYTAGSMSLVAAAHHLVASGAWPADPQPPLSSQHLLQMSLLHSRCQHAPTGSAALAGLVAQQLWAATRLCSIPHPFVMSTCSRMACSCSESGVHLLIAVNLLTDARATFLHGMISLATMLQLLHCSWRVAS